MKNMFDAFWRALVYCLHPRVMALSLLPLFMLMTGTWALTYFFWESAVAQVLQVVDGYPAISVVFDWLESWGLWRIRSVVGPAIVLLVFIPVMVVVSLLTVAAFMVPAMVNLVAQRRFNRLEKKHGGSWWLGLLWSLSASLLALFLMVLTWPLWFFPPAALVLGPLIWGWLTYRVMSFDALAMHASVQERSVVIKRHRYPLLAMGVISGCVGAAPALLWASGAMWVAMAPVVLPLAIWLYTLTFAFAGLWFAHYCLAALEQWRAQEVFVSSAVKPAAVYEMNETVNPLSIDKT